jgi:hypothetical protein
MVVSGSPAAGSASWANAMDGAIRAVDAISTPTSREWVDME